MTLHAAQCSRQHGAHHLRRMDVRAHISLERVIFQPALAERRIAQLHARAQPVDGARDAYDVERAVRFLHRGSGDSILRRQLGDGRKQLAVDEFPPNDAFHKIASYLSVHEFQPGLRIPRVPERSDVHGGGICVLERVEIRPDALRDAAIHATEPILHLISIAQKQRGEHPRHQTPVDVDRTRGKRAFETRNHRHQTDALQACEARREQRVACLCHQAVQNNRCVRYAPPFRYARAINALRILSQSEKILVRAASSG